MQVENLGRMIIVGGLMAVLLTAGVVASSAGGLPACVDKPNACATSLGICATNLAACLAEPRAIFSGNEGAGPGLSSHDRSDGTVTDNNPMSWSDSFTVFLAKLNTSPCFVGSCVWRVPKAKELQSIVDSSKSLPNPITASSSPGSTAAGAYWPTIAFADNSSLVWAVSAFDSSVISLVLERDGTFHVHAVRGVR